MQKIVVIIPVMDEARHVGDVVKRTRKKFRHVLVVDDGSTDGTAELAKQAGARVLSLPKNMGKGFAMRIGAIEALNDGADVVVFIDGDGQHRPEDIPRFLKKIEEGAKVVFGSRKGGRMPLVKRVGNWGIGVLFRLLFGPVVGDMLCGFKVMTREGFESVIWKSDGYFVETEIAARVATQKIEWDNVDVPIIYHDLKKGTTVKDGFEIGRRMLKLKVAMLRED